MSSIDLLKALAIVGIAGKYMLAVKGLDKSGRYSEEIGKNNDRRFTWRRISERSRPQWTIFLSSIRYTSIPGHVFQTIEVPLCRASQRHAPTMIFYQSWIAAERKEKPLSSRNLGWSGDILAAGYHRGRICRPKPWYSALSIIPNFHEHGIVYKDSTSAIISDQRLRCQCHGTWRDPTKLDRVADLATAVIMLG